jgi:aldose 1-epimerase
VLHAVPFPHRLRVTVALTPEAMTVDTALTATGDVPVPRAFGWHPLFTLPGVPREELDVTLPVRQESVLDDHGLPTGAEREPAWTDGRLGDRTLDAEYPAIDGPFVLRGGGRAITVRFGAPDYPVGHAWAPEGQAFVAWEPMTAPTNALVTGRGLTLVAPGETTVSRFVVEVAEADADRPAGSAR